MGITFQNTLTDHSWSSVTCLCRPWCWASRCCRRSMQKISVCGVFCVKLETLSWIGTWKMRGLPCSFRMKNSWQNCGGTKIFFQHWRKVLLSWMCCITTINSHSLNEMWLSTISMHVSFSSGSLLIQTKLCHPPVLGLIVYKATLAKWLVYWSIILHLLTF